MLSRTRRKRAPTVSSLGGRGFDERVLGIRDSGVVEGEVVVYWWSQFNVKIFNGPNIQSLREGLPSEIGMKISCQGAKKCPLGSKQPITTCSQMIPI
jgi:hypothetical protein